MRLGLDLRGIPDPAQRLAAAVEADRLGLWAVLVDGSDRGAEGSAAVEAAALATATRHLHLAMWLEGRSGEQTDRAVSLGLAEEVAIVDHISERRAVAVVDGPADLVRRVDDLLAGRIVDGVALTPPPAQTRVPVLAADEAKPVALTGRLDDDRRTIDQRRDQGTTHGFVTWPGPLTILARHLATRAAGPAFPQIVADLADVVAPLDG